MYVFTILGYLLIILVFLLIYIITYAMFIEEPIDRFLGFHKESLNKQKKRQSGSSFLSRTLYLEYWERLPFLVNCVLLIMNLAYIAMLVLMTFIYFTQNKLEFWLNATGVIQIVSILYIQVMCKKS